MLSYFIMNRYPDTWRMAIVIGVLPRRDFETKRSDSEN